MKNKKITRKITQGMYVLTTKNGGCIVDAVSQVSSTENPLIAVVVMKSNHTNQLLFENKIFAISVLAKNVNPEIIKTFGFNSSRDINKFREVKTTNISGLEVIDDSLGYMICEIVDAIDTNTHTLFIGKMIEADVYKEDDAMSYQYYQEHKEELLKVTTKNNQTAWICQICGYIYYGDQLPDDYKCPKCGVNKDLFKRIDNK